MNAQRPSPNAQRLTAGAFVAGAFLGGMLAGAVGGLLGAGLSMGALWVTRSAWPAPLRVITTLLLLVGGFGALWVGAGFVRATLGLIAGASLAR